MYELVLSQSKEQEMVIAVKLDGLTNPSAKIVIKINMGN